jgi:hypothetical protein
MSAYLLQGPLLAGGRRLHFWCSAPLSKGTASRELLWSLPHVYCSCFPGSVETIPVQRVNSGLLDWMQAWFWWQRLNTMPTQVHAPAQNHSCTDALSLDGSPDFRLPLPTDCVPITGCSGPHGIPPGRPRDVTLLVPTLLLIVCFQRVDVRIIVCLNHSGSMLLHSSLWQVQAGIVLEPLIQSQCN